MLGSCKADKPGVYQPFVHATYQVREPLMVWHNAGECALSCAAEAGVPAMYLRCTTVRGGGNAPTGVRPGKKEQGGGVRGNGFVDSKDRQVVQGMLVQVNIGQDELAKLV